MSPEEPPLPVALRPSEDEVKKLNDATAKAETEKDDALLAQAMREMELLRHDTFVPAIRRAIKSDTPEVAAAAIRAAASHQLKDVEKDLRKYVRAKSKPKKDEKASTGAMAAAAIDYLVRLDFEGDEEAVLEEHLKPLLADERRMKASWGRDMIRASVHYLGKRKYKPAVPFLIELIPQPEPKDVNADTNPPVSYWEARHKLWQASEGWVRWALKETTGQEFRQYREWEAWVRQNKKDFK